MKFVVCIFLSFFLFQGLCLFAVAEDPHEAFHPNVSLHFNVTPYLPASMIVDCKERTFTKALAFVSIDDSFQVFQLVPSKNARFYKLEFPTPKEKLVYRFVFVESDAKKIVTKEREVSLRCREEKIKKASGVSQVFKNQQELIQQSIEFEDQILQLEYVHELIKKISEEETTSHAK